MVEDGKGKLPFYPKPMRGKNDRPAFPDRSSKMVPFPSVSLRGNSYELSRCMCTSRTI